MRLEEVAKRWHGNEKCYKQIYCGVSIRATAEIMIRSHDNADSLWLDQSFKSPLGTFICPSMIKSTRTRRRNNLISN